MLSMGARLLVLGTRCGGRSERQECVAQLFGEWGRHKIRPVLPHAGNLLFPVGDKLLSAVVHAIVIKC